MASSDGDSSVSGVDVSATAVHLSPFRDQTTDILAGQDIPHDTPEGMDIQVYLDSLRSPTTLVSSSSDAEVPDVIETYS